MAEDKKRLFTYNGPIHDGKHKATPESAPTPESALEIIRTAFFKGRIEVSVHFKKQCQERSFDMMDAQNTIVTGKLRGSPEYCPEFANWKYRILAEIEDRKLEVVVALDPAEDYEKSPLIVLLTGYWRE
jgi:hypothetical protein